MQLDSTFWGQVKHRVISRNAGNKIVETWLNPVEFLNTSGSGVLPRIVLGVPSGLHKYYVEENLLEKIQDEISESLKSPFEIEIQISPRRPQSSQSLGEALNTQDHEMDTQGTLSETKSGSAVGDLTTHLNSQPTAYPNVSRKTDSLNPDYTFNSFVVGRNTEFAHAASFNVAQNPGADGYNPLLICGPVGMGKTHLLNAVGNQIKQAHPYLKIHFFSVERFLNDCVSALRFSEMDKFRQKYRESADVILVDDVQYIGKTEAIQEEFFHMVNVFLDRKKQVVVASDRMPKDIVGLADRSRSRLEWGLIADITMPDIETRVAILRYKAEKKGMKLPEDVVQYLSRISKRSIRELEGNLNKVRMFSELQGTPIEIELARKVLSQHETQNPISSDDIQKLVSEHFKVRITDLKSTTRAKTIVIPRQIAMYLIKKHLDKSLSDIGKMFGGKDHTTVMNALNRVEHLQSSDSEIRNDIEEITTRIHNITGV